MLDHIIAEGRRRNYLPAQTLAVLCLAIDEHWALPDVDPVLDQLDALEHPTVDPFYNLAQLRRVAPTDWQSFKKRLYRHIRTADALLKEGPPMTYGLPKGTRINYGNPGFPQWVYDLANKFGLKASTYPGHQENNRNEPGFAPNPQGLNRGIDWAGPVDDMQRFADYLMTIKGSLEQVIWQNPNTGQKAGVAGGKDVTNTNYYSADYAGHRDHVHTRQSAPIPMPNGGAVGFRGDPIWLADVLRAEGLQCDIADGAFQRGHGDMGDIWGVLCHHTGSNNATWQSIAFHPQLGLASQLHLSRTGIYTLCGVGVAWHAGEGSYPGVGTNNGNQRLIGIEAANDGGGSPGKPHRSSWPAVQYDAYVRGVAAILRKLGYDASHAIAHKEWAGRTQGKWDPGAIDMNIFRSDVTGQLATGGEDWTPVLNHLMGI